MYFSFLWFVGDTYLQVTEIISNVPSSQADVRVTLIGTAETSLCGASRIMILWEVRNLDASLGYECFYFEFLLR